MPSCRSGGIQHLALTSGSMFHRPGCRRALLKLLFTDHQQVDRHKHALQGTIKPDHFFVSIRYGRLEDPKIDVAVVIGCTTGMGAKQDDLQRLSCRHQPIHGVIQPLGRQCPRWLANRETVTMSWSRNHDISMDSMLTSGSDRMNPPRRGDRRPNSVAATMTTAAMIVRNNRRVTTKDSG